MYKPSAPKQAPNHYMQANQSYPGFNANMGGSMKVNSYSNPSAGYPGFGQGTQP